MKDVEIVTTGETKVYMRLDELFRIANKGVQDFADSVCRDNGKLQYQLEVAIEALKFYAADENYHMHGTYGNTNVRNDNGKIAKEALEEIEK